MPRGPIDWGAELPHLPPGHSLIDSHCHLDMADFEPDRAEILSRAAEAGVDTLITIGAGGSLEANEAALALAAAHQRVFATVGIHPHEASLVDDQVVDSIADLARRPKVVALGETGLDYYYDNSPRPQQQEAFRRFVALARRLSLPIVVHLRAADEDAARILRENEARDVGGVIHCFSGDARSARIFLDLGFHLSFSGIVTFKNSAPVREAASIVPADRLLVETDAPFLAPAPHRGRRNEPALLTKTAAVLAEVRSEALEVVAHHTRENTRRLFRLPA